MVRRKHDLTEQTTALNALATSLEKNLNQTLTRRFDKLSSEQQTALKSLLDTAMTQLSEQLLQTTISTGAATRQASGGSAQLGNAIGRLINLAVSEAFDSRQTRTNTQETERSQQADADFRRSKSQQQAQAAAQGQKGARNL